MTAWRATATELWCHFGFGTFTAAEAARAARHDPALDDALLGLCGSLDAETVETALRAHLGETSHGVKLTAWPTANGAMVFVFTAAAPITTGPV